jgi:hypothetical protein
MQINDATIKAFVYYEKAIPFLTVQFLCHSIVGHCRDRPHKKFAYYPD